MPRNLFSILAVITLLVSFIVLWESPPAVFSRDKGDPEKRKPTARSYLTDIKTTQYDEEGRISYVFSASKLSIFQQHPKRSSKNDYTEIEAPSLLLLSEGEAPWHLTADTGRTQGKNLTLNGNVLAWRENQQGHRSELSTTQLVVKPEQQYAETDKPVMITTVGSRTQAGGMKFYLKENKLVLTSKVRGRYDPQLQ